jgi:hypothetical protein
MQLRYDEDFIEAAVFLCASGRRKGVPSLQVARFHHERERLYSILILTSETMPSLSCTSTGSGNGALSDRWRTRSGVSPGARKADRASRAQNSRHKGRGTELCVNETGQRTALLALRLERLTDDPTSIPTCAMSLRTCTTCSTGVRL